MSSSEAADYETETDRNEEDIFTILVATDIHLGYGEKDPIRAQDTFVTFEEILKIALGEEVDFLLLGGDLFHDTRPSTHCLYKCTELLKRYCMGDRPVQVEFLSDPSHNFLYTGNPTVNYEDPNLNISLPVFSIHGNHDDPTGEYQISALNLLASYGLVNYFGKYNNHTDVNIEPILLQKGESKLALYGLSHIKDEKLGRLFLNKKVTIMAPPNSDNWFHLMVLHQNRANRGAKSFIPDGSLPSLLDLVIWGHEHDCRIDPERSDNDVFISQPGSSVATSLCIGESIKKHVGLLKIHGKQFSITPIPLKTVRPFIFGDLVFKELDEMQQDLDGYIDESLTHSAIAEKIVGKKVEDMIIEAQNLGQEGNMLPLLRLNVGYVDENQTFNAIRFGQRYIGRVANPEDMIKLRSAMRKPFNRTKKDDDFMTNVDNLPSRVEDLVMQHFEKNESAQLKCLSLKAVNEAVVRCIDSNDQDAPLVVINYLTHELRTKLEDEMVEIDRVEEVLSNIRITHDEAMLVDKILNNPNRGKKRSNDDVINIDADSDDDCSPSKASNSVARGMPTRPARGPGSRGGRGSRGRSSRAKGKADAEFQ